MLLRTKPGVDIVKTFQIIFNQGRKPSRIRTNKGSDYVTTDVRKYFREQNVIHFVTQNIVKISIAQEVIKTIKSSIAHYMKHNLTHRWIKVLPRINESYNKTYDQNIKRSPASVKASDHVELWKEIF